MPNNAYIYELLDNSFCVFNSINDILYLIYSNKKKSILFYNLIDNKIISEIKNAHSKAISNFRHYLDKKNSRDLLMSISFYDNNIKVWDVNNFECLTNITKINKYGILYSACFLNYDNNIYIITSNFAFGGTYVENIQSFDLKGNKIIELNDTNDDTYLIDIYFDIKSCHNYIITGCHYFIKAFDYNDNKLFCKYYDKDSFEHRSIIINDKEDKIIKLISSSIDGIIRIWNFYSGNILNKIKISSNLVLGLCLLNSDYLFIACDNDIMLLDMKKETIIKKLSEHENKVMTIKKINHPLYGKVIISLGCDNKIILWGFKNLE